jgi:hypothetical protein
MSETYGRPSSGRAGLRDQAGRAGNGLGDSRRDVAATLSALEEKLRALEQELSGADMESDPGRVEPPPRDAVPPASTVTPPPPRPPHDRLPPPPPLPQPSPLPHSSEELARVVAEARARMSELRTQVHDLLRFREQLRGSAQELIADYRSVLDGDAAAPPTGVPEVPDGSGPVRLLLDAGPFTDLATLASFEQALGRIPEMQDVYVRSFQDARASVELTLSGPAPLVDRMRAVAAHGFTVTDVSHDRLSIELEPAPPGPWAS